MHADSILFRSDFGFNWVSSNVGASPRNVGLVNGPGGVEIFHIFSLPELGHGSSLNGLVQLVWVLDELRNSQIWADAVLWGHLRAKIDESGVQLAADHLVGWKHLFVRNRGYYIICERF